MITARRPPRATATLAAIVAATWLAVAPAGCEPAGEASTTACGVDADCQHGQACAYGYCVQDGDNALVVHVRIVPADASGMLEQHVPALSLAAGRSLIVELLEPSSVKGFVLRPENAGNNVPGQIDARTAGDIPGFNYRSTAPSYNGIGTDHFGFSIALLPGRNYDVTFRPDQTDIPPHTERWTAETLLDADGQLDIDLPPRSVYRTLSGQVLFDGGDPIGAARVLALLPEGTATSSTLSDAETGEFSLSLPPDAAEVRLKVVAPEEGPLFPDHVSAPIALTEQATGDLDVPIPPLPPGVSPFEAALRVVGADGGGAPVPLPGLTVTVLGRFEGGTLRRTVTTDEDGVGRFLSLPGGYEVLVKAPAEVPWASWLGTKNLSLDKSEPTPVVDIALQPRARLAGEVLDHLGTPVEIGQVEATRREEGRAGGTLALAATTFHGALGPGGAFELVVDAGVYDLRVLPDASTGAPATRIAGLDVSLDPPFTTVELPPPGLLHLVVSGPVAGPLAGATVELYLDQDDDEDLAVTPPLLTRGTTGASGSVDLLVPFVL